METLKLTGALTPDKSTYNQIFRKVKYHKFSDYELCKRSKITK